MKELKLLCYFIISLMILGISCTSASQDTKKIYKAPHYESTDSKIKFEQEHYLMNSEKQLCKKNVQTNVIAANGELGVILYFIWALWLSTHVLFWIILGLTIGKWIGDTCR